MGRTSRAKLTLSSLDEETFAAETEDPRKQDTAKTAAPKNTGKLIGASPNVARDQPVRLKEARQSPSLPKTGPQLRVAETVEGDR